jgi:hypothetical protein
MYFQAASPLDGNQNTSIKTISKFADTVMWDLPAIGQHNTAWNERIVAAAQEAAQLRGIPIKHLFQ